MTAPRLTWDRGTAYDFFISLGVLHDPAEFNLRPAWAAGMRSRLPAADREFLELLHKADYLHAPLCWLYSLPEPKDSATMLYTLEHASSEERLGNMMLCLETPDLSDVKDILFDIARRGSWGPDDQAVVESVVITKCKELGKPHGPALKYVPLQLDLWANAAESGDRLLQALHSYYDVFFDEEERRIGPALDQAIANAQELASQVAPAELLEELSQGVKFGEGALNAEELVLVPTYWCSPLIFYDEISPNRMLITFGARPPADSLIPGETVPDALVVALKALSDPTRLQILRYLAEKSQTPTQLARSLRLRAPTVIHHLKTLRMAGLIQVNVTEGKERSYSARTKALETALGTLKGFIEPEELPVPEMG